MTPGLPRAGLERKALRPVPNFSKSNPNFPKSSQIQPSPAKINQRKILGFPLISFAESSLFNDLRRPPGPFFLFAPLPALTEATDGVGAARSPGFQCFLGLHFVLAFSSEVKGWRRFMIADVWAPSPPDLSAASLKGTGELWPL
jgi:hypothetical protein